MAQAPTPGDMPPVAASIEERLIQNFKHDQIALQSFIHLEHVVTRKDGATDGRALRVWFVHGRQVSETIALDNRRLSAEEIQAEHGRAMQRAEKAAKRPAPKPGYLEFGGKEYPFERLAHLYLYGPAKLGTWDGRKAWIYPAHPNPDFPSRSRTESLLLKSAGEVWVDAEDLHVERILLHTTAPVHYGFGIIADVHRAEMDLSLKRWAPGVWLPSQADFTMDATVLLFKTVKRSKEQSFYDYRPTN